MRQSLSDSNLAEEVVENRLTDADIIDFASTCWRWVIIDKMVGCNFNSALDRNREKILPFIQYICLHNIHPRLVNNALEGAYNFLVKVIGGLSEGTATFDALERQLWKRGKRTSDHVSPRLWLYRFVKSWIYYEPMPFRVAKELPLMVRRALDRLAAIVCPGELEMPEWFGLNQTLGCVLNSREEQKPGRPSPRASKGKLREHEKRPAECLRGCDLLFLSRYGVLWFSEEEIASIVGVSDRSVGRYVQQCLEHKDSLREQRLAPLYRAADKQTAVPSQSTGT